MNTRILKLRTTKSQILQQGLAVVEFAIILPVILLIALAVTEAGRAMYQYNTLTKSVQNGVRYLSDKAIDGSGQLNITTTLEDDTKNLVIYGDINGGTPLLPTKAPSAIPVVTVSQFPLFMYGDAAGVGDNHVKVTATYTFSPLFNLGGLGYQRVIPQFNVSAVERALKL